MQALLKKFPLSLSPSKLLFLIPPLYWLYLIVTAQTIIVHDSVWYEEASYVLLQPDGWAEYLRSGPGREPLYPYLISIAIKLSGNLSVSYLLPLHLIQFCLLFLTQLMAYRIMKMLPLHQSLRLAVCLYIGLSPALINSALSVYSEILALPFATGIVLYSSSLVIKKKKRLYYACMLGLMLAGATLVKASFEIIGPLYLLLVFLCSRFQAVTKDHRIPIVILLIAAATFYAPLITYKYLNYRYNGNFVLTDRGGYALYGSTVARIQPTTAKHLLAAAAWIPSPGFCNNFFDKSTCFNWSTRKPDDFGTEKQSSLKAQGHSMQQVSSMLIGASLQTMLLHPFQYALLTFLQMLKIFFWESMQMGFVVYPFALQHLFNNSAINNLLVLTVGSLTLLGLMTALIKSWHQLTQKQTASPSSLVVLHCALMGSCFALLHAPFFILPRYSLPIAPIWIILIACLLSPLLDAARTFLLRRNLPVSPKASK